jgi:hypothetical protein
MRIVTFSTIIASAALLTGTSIAEGVDRQLVLGMKQSIVERIYKGRMERWSARMLRVYPVRYEGYQFADAELRFSRAHRLIGIRGAVSLTRTALQTMHARL